MKGPTKNERNKIGSQIVRWEIALVFAGGIVVSGLLWESWSEITTAVRLRRLPNRQTTGNLLVTIGVASEVVIAARIARLSRRSEEIADREIAELREVAATAETRTTELQIDLANARERQADAERLLVDLRLDSVPRSMMFDWQTFSAVLESSPKGTIEVLYPPENSEAFELAGLVIRCFVATGWNVPTDIIPIPEDPTGLNPGIVLAGGRSGITIRAAGAIDGPFKAAVDAFKAVAKKGGRQYQPRASSSMDTPEGVVRIIIGPKL